MKISKYHKDILKAKICPYCKSKTRRVTEESVYKRSYKGTDMIICVRFPKCNSYVGTHKSGKPLGRLANFKLRRAKKSTHKYFDKLWNQKYMKRNEAYSMLSKYLEIPREYTHIGMFSIKTCEKTIEWSKQLLIKLKDEKHNGKSNEKNI